MRQGPRFRHAWRVFPGTKGRKAEKGARPSHRSKAGRNVRRRVGVTGGVSTPNRQGGNRAASASTPAPFSLEPGPPFLRVCLIIRGGRSLGSLRLNPAVLEVRPYRRRRSRMSGSTAPGYVARPPSSCAPRSRVVDVGLLPVSNAKMIPYRPAWREPAGRSVATPLDGSKREPSPLGRHAGGRKHLAAGALTALPEGPSCYHGAP